MKNFDEQSPEKPILTPEEKEEVEKEMKREKEEVEKEMKRILTPQQIEAVRELVRGNPKEFDTEITKLAQEIAKRYRLSSEISFYLAQVAEREIEKLKEQKKGDESDEKQKPK